MGLGAFVVRSALVTVAGATLYAGVVSPLIGKIRDNAQIENGYVSPKSLSVQGKKNGQGNIETYLQYKSGDGIVSLPCAKGPSGPLCGTIDYWWQSVGAPQREELAVGEWPAISNDAKHGIMSKELQTIVDTFYGAQRAPQPAPQQTYRALSPAPAAPAPALPYKTPTPAPAVTH